MTLQTIIKPVLVQDFSPILNVKINVTAERFEGTDFAPPVDSNSRVVSKDVLVHPEANLSSRFYLPQNIKLGQKLPLLVYFHGGGFFLGSPFTPIYHNYLNQLVDKTNVIAVSVDYRLAPEFPLPIAFDDCWTSLKWIASHSIGYGSDEWLRSYADFRNVILAGDSAGATIAHNMAMRAGNSEIEGMTITGMALLCPYFWGSEVLDGETDEKFRAQVEDQWKWANPKSKGIDDPLFNPFKDPDFPRKLGCKGAQVIVCGNDNLRFRGMRYNHILSDKANGWNGTLEPILCVPNERHDFQLFDPNSKEALEILDCILHLISSFIHKLKLGVKYGTL